MLATTTSGRFFDDETEFRFLYMLADDTGSSEWAFQPVIDGKRLDLLRTLPPDEVGEWIDRNHVGERMYCQLARPLPILEEHGR